MRKLIFIILPIFFTSCQPKAVEKEFTGQDGEVKLVTLNPAHFHASLIQKNMLPQINKVAYVYAPEGADVDAHLSLIENYNSRDVDPTDWAEEVYKGEDFLQKMIVERKANVLVLAGNNKMKTDYIGTAVECGFNVLSDKPMAISKEAFVKLEKSYALAAEKGVLLYDMMTERYEVSNMVQKELMQDEALFGTLINGTPENPAVESESVHHFLKTVSGKPLIRPMWYYDVEQQGDGIVDVTTHLIDLIMWKCFPNQAIHFKNDIVVNYAGRWATSLSLDEFGTSTNALAFPSFLQKDIQNDKLHVFSNGFIQYETHMIAIARQRE